MFGLRILRMGMLLAGVCATTVQASDLDGDGVPDEVDACCNTPAGHAVDATGRPVGDLDEDCDVDLADHAMLAANLTGPLGPVPCPTCTDGQLNGDETDQDCGGGLCPPCADGLLCQAGTDCQSQVCELGVCQAPTCSDGVLNGDELDIDCGGSCPPCTLPNGVPCSLPSDCTSGFCIDGVCCGTTCSGPCRACNLSGFEGTCWLIPTGTDPEDECSGAQVCDGMGACKSVLGMFCGSPFECLSGFCADNRCCDDACLGTCEACDLTGTTGMCTFIPDGEDPDDECDFPFSNCDGSGGCG